MNAKVKPIPDGFEAVIPYLIVKNAQRAIDFYKRAFGARERSRLSMPDGKIAHAELQIRNSVFMLTEESPEHRSPQTLDGSPVNLALYVENVDKAFDQAVGAGASVKDPVSEKFWGDRAGCLIDPFGHTWSLLTHIEDVPPDKIKERMAEACSEAAGHRK